MCVCSCIIKGFRRIDMGPKNTQLHTHSVSLENFCIQQSASLLNAMDTITDMLL